MFGAKTVRRQMTAPYSRRRNDRAKEYHTPYTHYSS